MSNIAKLFEINKKPKDPHDPKEDCLGCLAMASGVMTLGGAYLFSGAVFYNKGKPLPNVTAGYKMAVRGAGVPVFIFGLYRGYQAWQFYQEKGFGEESTPASLK